MDHCITATVLLSQWRNPTNETRKRSVDLLRLSSFGCIGRSCRAIETKFIVCPGINEKLRCGMEDFSLSADDARDYCERVDLIVRGIWRSKKKDLTY